MSAVAVIDVLEFARERQHLRGSLLVSSLTRLEDVLYDTTGALEYELRGGRDALDRLQVQLTIVGPLHLQCQRCLGGLDHEVDVSSTLLVLARGEQASAEIENPEAPDAIEADPELDVATLVEDEVLLSLPLAPRHAEGTCESRLNNEQDTAHLVSAFAQLAALKRPLNKR